VDEGVDGVIVAVCDKLKRRDEFNFDRLKGF